MFFRKYWVEKQIIQRILFIVAVIVGIIAVVYAFQHAGQFFNRRAIGGTRRYILSFGIWAPIIVFSLLIISTLIPPLPLPVTLIEIASGLAFGFQTGFLLIWISQVISSLLAFVMGRKIGKKILSRLLKTKLWQTYSEYLDKRGVWAVLIIRGSMVNPFDIISYAAGLTQIDFKNFILVTIIATIPESFLFTYIGSQLRSSRLSLWYLSLIITALAVFGLIASFFMIRFVQKDVRKKKTLIN